MKDAVPRMRMFAGPNGSGKTTVKKNLGKPDEWFGLYINPDEMEKVIRETGCFPTALFGLSITTDAIRTHFVSSAFLQAERMTAGLDRIIARPEAIDFTGIVFNSYHASVLADFFRQQALESGRSFTFETVMSAPDKVDVLRTAQQRGFRTYLYYIATEDPEINIQRVRNRVLEGGHDVPEEKIKSRYHRSLELVTAAIPHTDRAFFFDTSEADAIYVAEATGGTRLELKSDHLPRWFEAIWDRFGSDVDEEG